MMKRSFVLLAVLAVSIGAVAQVLGGPATVSPQTRRELNASERAYLIKARTELLKAIPLLTNLKPLGRNADQARVESVRNNLRIQMVALGDTLGSHGYWYYMPSDFSVLGSKVREMGDALGMDCGLVNSQDDETNVMNYLTLVNATMTPDLSLHKDSAPSDPYGLNSPYTRQFTVLSESVRDVRAALDSLYIGPEQRQTVQPAAPMNLMTLKELLSWTSSFATVEGPRLSQSTDQPKLNARVCRLSTNLQRIIENDPRATNEQLQPKLLKLQNSLLQLRQQTIQGREQFLPCRASGC